MVKRVPEVGMRGRDAWLVAEQDVGGLNPSPGDNEEGGESLKSA